MALDTPTVWGKAVADAIKAIGVSAGTPVTDGQLESIWAAIVGEHRTQLTVNAAIATTVAVASVSGVTVGAGVSGPGTGSGTGGIS